MNQSNMTLLCRQKGDDNVVYQNAAQKGMQLSIVTEKKTSLGKELVVQISNDSQTDFCGVLEIRLSTPYEDLFAFDPQFFMPGYMYGRNTGANPRVGRKEFPRIRLTECVRPESKYWMTRSDRLALPTSMLYAGGRVLGIAATPYLTNLFAGFTCGIDEASQSCYVGYTLGYENAPWLFVQTMTVLDRSALDESNCICIKAGAKMEFDLQVFDYAVASVLEIHDAMKEVYYRYHQAPRQLDGMDVHKAAKLLAEAMRDETWLPDEKMYTGFVYDQPNGNITNKIGSLSWTNGMAVATPMLMAGNRLQDDVMREQAITFIENVITNSMNPASGLPYDAVEDGKWSIKGWWYDGMHSGGHSGYLCGQALYYILKAYLSEKEMRGVEHSDWIDFVKPIVNKLNGQLNADYEYPFALSAATGAGLEYDSLGGAWCLVASALLCQITGNQKDLMLMEKAEQHYYEQFVKKVVCYGGPLDTDKAVDNEGILAYVRAARILHEITGKEEYLEHLRDGLYYEFTFKLGYNTQVQVPPLSTIGWSSCGGSITSTANPHIHPMSSTDIDEMIYYLKYREDGYAKDRVEDTLGWGMQTLNTDEKEYGYGRIGWMSERFCFCQGLLTEKYPDGSPASTWFALMSWASCSIIEGFVGDAWNRNP